ncbi:MAG: SRPBCC domain-containing protein [Myxococcaceae bacterium]
MNARSEKQGATVERRSDRELVVTRSIKGPARLVWDAWTKSELFVKWWVPPGAPIKILKHEADVRVGGKYRLTFGFLPPGDPQARMDVFGTYLEVVPHQKLKWTNEEDGGGGAVTTLTFDEKDGRTTVVVHDLYPSKQALDEAIASGSTEGMPASLAQLDEFVATLE